MSRKRKANKTGRGGNALSSFVALERYILNSAAWRDLSAIARAAYIELAAGFDGSNNGRIVLGSRTLGERMACNKSTAARALAELTEHGFVECRKRGGFVCKVRHASEWRLTAFKCDVSGDLPSKDFMRWQSKMQESVAPVPPYGGTGETAGAEKAQKDSSRWHGRNHETQFEGMHGGTDETLLHSNHREIDTGSTFNTVGGAANQKASASQPLISKSFERADLTPIGDILDLTRFVPLDAA